MFINQSQPYWSLAGNVVTALAEADANRVETVLRALGTESNTVGGCNIDVASLNGYNLQHDVDAGLYLHDANT